MFGLSSDLILPVHRLNFSSLSSMSSSIHMFVTIHMQCVHVAKKNMFVSFFCHRPFTTLNNRMCLLLSFLMCVVCIGRRTCASRVANLDGSCVESTKEKVFNGNIEHYFIIRYWTTRRALVSKMLPLRLQLLQNRWTYPVLEPVQ